MLLSLFSAIFANFLKIGIFLFLKNLCHDIHSNSMRMKRFWPKMSFVK
jgi:hypothetical protein